MTERWGTADLLRAPSGAPVITADSEPAAFFALGYAQAVDQPDALVRAYLLARGELSTLDGEDARERDENQRRWRILDEAREAFERLPAAHQDLYRAFVAGVQQAFEEHGAPEGAPALEPALPIAAHRTVFLFWTIADAVGVLRASGIPVPALLHEAERAPMTPGSNAWVLSGDRVSGAKAVLVSDPHLPFGTPFELYEATLHGGSLAWHGFMFVGGALPPLASTPSLAWGCTTGGPRVSDAYRIADTDEPWVTLNGVPCPVVARHEGSAYAICSPYTGRPEETEAQLLRMLRARTIDELWDALADRAFPPQNILAADAAGATMYVRTGRVPRRAPEHRGILDEAVTWDGFLEPEELVHVRRPDSDWLQNANSSPDTLFHGFDVSGFTLDAVNDLPGRQSCRGERGWEILESAQHATIADVLRWTAEAYWPDTPAWRDGLRAAVQEHADRIEGWDEARREALDALLHFDGNAPADSVTAHQWVLWRWEVAHVDLDPSALRDAIAAFDAGLLVDAVERMPLTDVAYGDAHRLPDGTPGRGGAFLVRPPAPGDVQFDVQVPVRATYYRDGVAIGGGACVRVTAFTDEGPRLWSQALPRDGALFSAGEIRAAVLDPADAAFARTLDADAATVPAGS